MISYLEERFTLNCSIWNSFLWIGCCYQKTIRVETYSSSSRYDIIPDKLDNQIHNLADDEAYAVFDVEKTLKLNDFNKVRAKIEEYTDKIAGKNKGIVNDPIVLNVFSHSCPDLTLIDLPGITRIPLANSDQKQDIEKITKEMAS